MIAHTSAAMEGTAGGFSPPASSILSEVLRLSRRSHALQCDVETIVVDVTDVSVQSADSADAIPQVMPPGTSGSL